MTFVWQVEEKGGGDPGGRNVVSSLFGGKDSVRIDTFVREDLQNHHDALNRDEPETRVRVVIRFMDISRETFERYFPQEFQHRFRESELKGLPESDRLRRADEIDTLFGATNIPFLIIEDFGTIGLCGPVNTKIVQKTEGHPLFHKHNALTCFMRRNGESGKTGKQLGSAGLGRHVYYMCSQIRSKLLYTVPINLYRKEQSHLVELDPRPLFFGQACLNEWMDDNDDGERTYGNYYTLSPGKESDERAAVYPPYGLTDEEVDAVDNVRRDFGLLRHPHIAGLSIMIPFPRKNVNADNIVRAIAKDFPIPILDGRLTVELNDRVIDYNSIVDVSDNEEVRGRNLFLKEAGEEVPEMTLEIGPNELSSSLDREMFPDADELQLMSEEFAEGKTVGVRVSIRFGDEPEEVGNLLLHAKSSRSENRGKVTITRQGLEITRHSEAGFSNRWNSLGAIQGDALGSLLRASEDPSHNEWVAADIASKCPMAADLIRFITECPRHFVTILNSLDQKLDDVTWADLFPSEGGGDVDPDPPDPESRQRPFLLHMEDRATAVIRPTEHLSASDIEQPWTFELIFDTVRGNRRKVHRPGAILLESTSVEIDKGRTLATKENRVIVKIDSHVEFSCRIGPCSFPEWADVHLRAAKVRTPPTTEAHDDS